MFTRFFCIFIILLPALTHAEGTDDPNEFTERILLFRTKAGDLLFDGLIAHEIDRTLYISAVDLLETLGFKTETSLDSKVFTATTLSPQIDVTVRWPNCSLKVNKEKSDFNCSKIIIYEDEVFISSALLGTALKSKFEYLPFKSEVRIDTDVAYPKLSTLKRKGQKSQIGRRADFDPGYKRKDVEPQTFKNLYIDQQFTWTAENDKDDVLQYYSNLSTDVLQHEVQFTTQGDNKSNDFNTWSVKREFYGSQRNEYISSYQLGNVVIPTAELIGGPQGGRGFYVTNREQQLINFGQREFEGNLRPEWEVELYLDDNLFDRQQASENGRYRFQNVPVLFGQNNFRLEFYGPLGERRTEYINNSVAAENLSKGQFRYETGLTTQTASSSGKPVTESLIQTSYGLTNTLSTYAAFTRHSIFSDEQVQDFSILGLNGYIKNLNYGFFRGDDFFNNGHLYAARTQFVLRRTRLQFTYLDADNFKSNLVGTSNQFLDKGYKLNLNTSLFGRASVLYRAGHDVFEDGTEETTAIQNIVLPISRITFLLKNDLVTGLNNKVDLVYTYLRNQFRSTLTYDWGDAKSFDFEYRNRFKRESSIFLSYAKNIEADADFFKAGYQQRFKHFSLGLDASTDAKKEYTIQARLRSSFGYTKSLRSPQMSPDLLASSGNVCVKVYYDRNANGILEEELDRPLENVSLRWVQGNFDFSSNKYGSAFLTNLPLYTPVDVQLLVKTLEDPQMTPVEAGFRVHLQKGQCAELTFLVKRVFDFEGQIFMAEGMTPKRLTVQLTDAYGEVLKESRTDKDGYFLFAEQPARAYYLKIKDKDYTVKPDVYVINPYSDDSLEQDLYFDVSK